MKIGRNVKGYLHSGDYFKSYLSTGSLDICGLSERHFCLLEAGRANPRRSKWHLRRLYQGQRGDGNIDPTAAAASQGAQAFTDGYANQCTGRQLIRLEK